MDSNSKGTISSIVSDLAAKFTQKCELVLKRRLFQWTLNNRSIFLLKRGNVSWGIVCVAVGGPVPKLGPLSIFYSNCWMAQPML